MLQYSDFILEQTIYNLIMESKVEFSENFIRILNAMDSPIAKEVLSLNNQEKEVAQNYIDSDLKGDMITFIQDRRAKQVIKDKEGIYKMMNAGKHLKIKDFKSDVGRDQSVEIYRLLGINLDYSH